MFNDYFNEEIEIMPNFLKAKYVRAIRGLIKEEQFSNEKSSIEAIFALGQGTECSLKQILREYPDLMVETHKNIELNKSMKYAALFELDDDRKPDDIISLIASDNTLLNSTIELSNPNMQLKAIKLGDMLKFTFLLNGIKIQNGNPVAHKTTYSVVVKFWEVPTGGIVKKFVEIDADNVATYFRHDRDNFFVSMINLTLDYLQNEFSLSLDPIDLIEVVEIIRGKEKTGALGNLPKASAQKMLLSSGSQAILDSNDAEVIILPILGELKKLIEDNEQLFSTSQEVKVLLEDFISETEAMADLPWVTFTWDNKIKSKKVQVKLVLSEYPFTMLNYYSHTQGRSGMNDVIESLLKEYSSIENSKGEEFIS